MGNKFRTPTNRDIAKATKWLLEAQSNLEVLEYFRTKRLCWQVIRVLRRKETESVTAPAGSGNQKERAMGAQKQMKKGKGKGKRPPQ